MAAASGRCWQPVGRLGRRQDHHLQAAAGRRMARWQAVHRGGRRLLGDRGLEELRHLGQAAVPQPQASIPRRHHPQSSVRQADAAAAIENALRRRTSVLRASLCGTDIAKNPHNETLVGTGPFRYAEHKPGDNYRLTRNPTYWDKASPTSTRSSSVCCPIPARSPRRSEAKEIQPPRSPRCAQRPRRIGAVPA